MHTQHAVPADFPVTYISTRYRIIPAFQFWQTDIRMGINDCLFKSRFHRTNTTGISIYEFHDRSIGIMIQRIHTCIADHAVLSYGIPALPDSGRTQVHTVKPAGESLFQKKIIGQFIQSGFRQYSAQKGCSHKSAFDLLHIFCQTHDKLLDQLVSVHIEPEFQRCDVAGLCIHRQASVRCEKLCQHGFSDVLLQCTIVLCVFCFIQTLSHFTDDLCGMVIINRTDIGIICTSFKTGGCSTVQGQPVSKLKARIIKILSSPGRILTVNIIHPVFHHRVLFFNFTEISVVCIIHIRQHCADIPPYTAAVILMSNVWHIIGNTAVQKLLFVTKILHKLMEKCPCIHMIAGCRSKNLRITCPPQALTSLRAIRRHIDKIAL